jgi:predicted nucleic acid-binding protein
VTFMKLVDTSAWIEFLRRRGAAITKQAVARLIQEDAAAYSCPIAFELISGVRQEEESDLERALSFSRHIPFQPDDWRMAASWERKLREQGVTVPRNDLFVATVAMHHDLIVVCRDTHFDMIANTLVHRLKVEQV